MFSSRNQWLSVNEAEQMVEEAKKRGRKILVGFGPRWQPASVQAKAAIDAGRIGRPVFCASRQVNLIRVPTQRLSWSSQTTLAHWLLTHSVDRVRWFMGTEAKQVTTYIAQGVLKAMGVDTPDLYHAVVEFEGGGLATFDAVWILPNTTPNRGIQSLYVVGSEGWISVDNTYPILKIATKNGYEEPNPFSGDVFGEPVNQVATQVRHFVRVLRENTQPALSARDALAVTCIVCTIDESARTGQPVFL